MSSRGKKKLEFPHVEASIFRHHESRLLSSNRVQHQLKLLQETQTPATMALPLQAGLTPMEVAFLCEMEMVTVIPRQRLESLNLLSVSPPRSTPPSSLHSPLGLQTNIPFSLRAQRQLCVHRTAQPSPSGSPSSSNANAAPTFSPHHGYCPPPSNESSDTRPRPLPSLSHLHHHIHTPSHLEYHPQTMSRPPFSLPRPLTRPRITCLTTGLSLERYYLRLQAMMCQSLIEYGDC